ncbi:hypothetical protein HHL08_23080 [Sphingobium sp. AR-3-1]|uniref:Uncharacterized protein n=1 Tax=Sphingobium psychrophilum TaxID=2728834 RepID=A0A7X9WZZ3_9SPHN|nr:hypothetical protein [Sphingobium psychrophilum]NML12979.1 hypothetical protein [Sphingobium psychrophilum]
MFRGRFLFFCMLLASLATATAIHARELAGSFDIECSGYVHNESDGDRSPGDADQAVAHHHGNCHGAAAFLPARSVAPNIFAFLNAPENPQDRTALGRWISGPDLRPPIA